ncbi:hypothetical protein BSL78_03183 [Apostichopus japonicus]|uniref:Protein LTV1 homolog n=1 Tax=Stichopus japonicus TaxID=307972 RepID=A0A2G8LI07_STIJA|nr:hypothetical protein BSL78_03183 [Apostichopus japonicus]
MDSDADLSEDEFSSGGEGGVRTLREERKLRPGLQIIHSALPSSEERKIFEEYDDMEMGALDHDDIEGFVPDDSEILKQVMSEFEDSRKKLVLEKAEEDEVYRKDRQSEDGDDSSDDLEKDQIEVEESRKEKWDCESILSTYSNLYNHPKIIDDGPRKKKPDKVQDGTIRLSSKTGMPLGVLPAPGPTKKQLERQELEEYRLPLVLPHRKKGQKESVEERKDRKQAIKIERKMRRIEKKANKEAFKEEEKTQKKIMMNRITQMQGVKVT